MKGSVRQAVKDTFLLFVDNNTGSVLLLAPCFKPLALNDI